MTLLWSLLAVLPLVRVVLALPIETGIAIAAVAVGAAVGVAPRVAVLDWLAPLLFVVVVEEVQRSYRCNSMISCPRGTTEHLLDIGAHSQRSVRRFHHRRCVALVAEFAFDFRRARFDDDSLLLPVTKMMIAMIPYWRCVF